MMYETIVRCVKCDETYEFPTDFDWKDGKESDTVIDSGDVCPHCGATNDCVVLSSTPE